MYKSGNPSFTNPRKERWCLHFTGEETEAQSEEVVAHDNLSLVGQ